VKAVDLRADRNFGHPVISGYDKDCIFETFQLAEFLKEIPQGIIKIEDGGKLVRILTVVFFRGLRQIDFAHSLFEEFVVMGLIGNSKGIVHGNCQQNIHPFLRFA
jgi:hypothetical protein